MVEIVNAERYACGIFAPDSCRELRQALAIVILGVGLEHVPGPTAQKEKSCKRRSRTDEMIHRTPVSYGETQFNFTRSFSFFSFFSKEPVAVAAAAKCSWDFITDGNWITMKLRNRSCGGWKVAIKRQQTHRNVTHIYTAIGNFRTWNLVWR